ncbi:hypothetical protein CUJ83_11570 [Methanocella sp. CWC-04]|uniref:Uncharacterized protein n=1 Tax=Methanooceanicella nereidis TaxID=2052831 RepID=A0AAP2RDJ6_9EURY|nr:hypothetical protein [Methanocella sp. CWC-04]
MIAIISSCERDPLASGWGAGLLKNCILFNAQSPFENAVGNDCEVDEGILNDPPVLAGYDVMNPDWGVLLCIGVYDPKRLCVAGVMPPD